MTLTVRLQKDNRDGKIYPPFLKIKYNHVTDEDYNSGNVRVSFKVVYEMDTNNYQKGMEISLGILCTVALIYSVFQAWNWNKRSGKINCDFAAILKLILYGFGSVGNALFAIALGSSFYWVITFKVSKCLPKKKFTSPKILKIYKIFIHRIKMLLHFFPQHLAKKNYS